MEILHKNIKWVTFPSAGAFSDSEVETQICITGRFFFFFFFNAEPYHIFWCRAVQKPPLLFEGASVELREVEQDGVREGD